MTAIANARDREKLNQADKVIGATIEGSIVFKKILSKTSFERCLIVREFFPGKCLKMQISGFASGRLWELRAELQADNCNPFNFSKNLQLETQKNLSGPSLNSILCLVSYIK